MWPFLFVLRPSDKTHPCSVYLTIFRMKQTNEVKCIFCRKVYCLKFRQQSFFFIAECTHWKCRWTERLLNIDSTYGSSNVYKRSSSAPKVFNIQNCHFSHIMILVSCSRIWLFALVMSTSLYKIERIFKHTVFKFPWIRSKSKSIPF